MEPFDAASPPGVDGCDAEIVAKALEAAHHIAKRHYLRTDRVNRRRLTRYAYENLDAILPSELARSVFSSDRDGGCRTLERLEPLLEGPLEINRKHLWKWRSSPEWTEYAYVPYGSLDPERRREARKDPCQLEQWRNLFGSATPAETFPTRTSNPVVDPTGILIYADCLHGLRRLRSELKGRIACLYADPPYNTRTSRFAYDDCWSPEAWLGMLEDRIEAALPLLRDDGWLWLQANHRQAHRLRMLLDDLTGSLVQNDVVWVFGASARGAKAVSHRLPRNYDSLLLAAISKRSQLKRLTQRVAIPEAVARRLGFRNENGQWYKTAPRGDYTDESIARLESEGRIYRTGNGSLRKRYDLDSHEGFVFEDRPIGDVWLDIPDMMHAPFAERLGFPSQKPVALLRRILSLSASLGDWVIDPFAGTGTTAVAAHQLGMRFAVMESGSHFETLLLPRVLRELQAKPATVKVLRSTAVPDS